MRSPATSQAGASAPPLTYAGGTTETSYKIIDANRDSIKQEPTTPSVSATELRDDASIVGSSVTGAGVYPHATQSRPSDGAPNPAQFGIGSHYSHTSDADLGYMAKTIVRPPRDQLGKLQVHVHGVALIGAKSRVETQIRMRIELVRSKAYYPGGPDPRYGEELAPDLGMTSPQAISTAHARFGPPELWQRIGTFTHVKLPPGTGTRRKTRKHKEPQVDPQDTLFLDATVVNASPPHNRVYVCEGCRTRERKRILRMKGRSKRNGDAGKTTNDSAADTGSADGADGDRKANGSEQDEPPTLEEIQAMGIDPSLPNAVELAVAAREERARERVVVFNTGDYVEFHNGEAVLPTRITCYCRHHKEKIGFCIIFTLRDWTGQLLATGTTPPIMITDDHKTSQGPQAQAQMQAQADALAEVLAQAHANKVASLRAQGITPPPNFHRPSAGDVAMSPHAMPRLSHNLDLAGDVPAQDGTIGRVARQRRKSSSSRSKPYARNSSIASSSHTNSAANRLTHRRPSRVSSNGADTAMSPASNEGTGAEFDPRMSIASAASLQQPEVSQYTRSVVSPLPVNEVHHVASPISGHGTVPTGSMPLSALQPGLAPDTLRPLAESGALSALEAQNNGLSAFPDSAMLLQAYTFARSQAEAAFGNNPMFFNSQGQPNPHVYAPMVSAMQTLNNGQQLSTAGFNQDAQHQPPMIHPPPLTAPGHRPSTASAAEAPMEAPGTAAALPSTSNSDGRGVPTQTPKVHQLIPREGPTTGGIEVTVLGENFVEGISAVFGDQPAVSTKVWANNTLVCLLPPASSPGPVIVSIRLPNTHAPNVPEADEQASPLAFFTYVELADRSLMELALQVVGLKMTGQMHSARDVAMRVVGTGAERGDPAGASGGTGSSSSGAEGQQRSNGAVLSQFSYLAQVATSGSSRSLNFQDSLLTLLAMSDEDVPPPPHDHEENEDHPRWKTKARLAPERRSDAIRLTNQAGQTLLHLAVVLGFSRLTDDLLRRGAPVNAQDRCGMTPLHFAAMHGRTSVTRRLLSNFADPFARMRLGLSPLELARIAGQEDTVIMLDAHLGLIATAASLSAAGESNEVFEAEGWDVGVESAVNSRCTSIDEDNLSSNGLSDFESESGSNLSANPVEVAPSLAPAASHETEASLAGAEKPLSAAVERSSSALPDGTDLSNTSSSASEKKTLAARLATMAPETAPRKFGLSKLQHFLSPAAFSAAPISAFRMELPLAEPTLAPEPGGSKRTDLLRPMTETAVTSAPGSSQHARRRSKPSASSAPPVRKRGSKGKGKDLGLDGAIIVSPSNGGVKGARRSQWWEDRMLVLFWLPALFVALVVFLLISIGPLEHLYDTMRQGSLFKLYPDERAM